MKTALGYIRISRDDEHSVSLDYQTAEIRKLAAKEGLDLIGIEADEGISGKSIAARPAVKRVLEAVDRQAVNAVIIYRSDRISRDGLESLQIDKLFANRGVSLLSVSEGCLTSDSLDDELLRFLRAGLNQRERRLISLRTKQALNRKRERGERIGGRPPYGFRVVDGALVPDENEQAAIARMRALQGKGYSTREIVKALESEGYRNRKGGLFCQTQVCRILRAA